MSDKIFQINGVNKIKPKDYLDFMRDGIKATQSNEATTKHGILHINRKEVDMSGVTNREGFIEKGKSGEAQALLAQQREVDRLPKRQAELLINFIKNPETLPKSTAISSDKILKSLAAAAPNARDLHGDAPIHLAIKAGKEQIAGAIMTQLTPEQLFATNGDGKTALDLSVEKQMKDLTATIAKKADMNVPAIKENVDTYTKRKNTDVLKGRNQAMENVIDINGSQQTATPEKIPQLKQQVTA